MFDQRWFLIIFILIFVILLIICIIYVGKRVTYNKTKIKKFTNETKSFVINLDKNTDRLKHFMDSYQKSDIKDIPIERFNAINGKEVDLKKYVTTRAYDQIMSAETNGYRLRHYELTRGAVGCFLSHTALYKKLLDDPDHEYYFIFEDDSYIPPSVIKPIQFYMENAPSDWDMMLFGVIREVLEPKNSATFQTESWAKYYDKVKIWWGLFGYAINKKGAKRFLDELTEEKRIDKQIDSMMSMMVKDKQLVVYSTGVHLVKHDTNGSSDIQLPIKIQSDVNPYKYENVELFTNYNEY